MAGEDERGGSRGDLEVKRLFHFSEYLTTKSTSDYSQKQTSWVFNDQPCECADVGHSRKIGRAAKMGWEKIWLPAMIAASKPVNRLLVDFTGLLGVPGHYCSSGATDPILSTSTQRIPRGRDPVFIYTKNRWG